MTYLENQSRWNNIRINGIPEDKNKSWDQTETKVKETLNNTLNLDFEPLFEGAHRTGRVRYTNINKPRTIICKLYDWKVKEAILRSARAIKPANIYVSEEYANFMIGKWKKQFWDRPEQLSLQIFMLVRTSPRKRHVEEKNFYPNLKKPGNKEKLHI